MTGQIHALVSLLALLAVNKCLTTATSDDTTRLLQILTSQEPERTTARPVSEAQKSLTESGPTSSLLNLLGSTPWVWNTPTQAVTAGQLAVKSTNPWLYWSTRAQNNPSTPYYGTTYPYWFTSAQNNPSTPYYGSTYPYWFTSSQNNPSTPHYGSTSPYWFTSSQNNPTTPHYGSTYPYWFTSAQNNPSTPYYGAQTTVYRTRNSDMTTQPAYVPTSAPRSSVTLSDNWETTHSPLAGLMHLTISPLADGGNSLSVNCTLDALPNNTVGIVSLVISKYSGQPIPRYADVATINIFHPNSPKLGQDFQTAVVKGVLNNDNNTFYLSVQSSLASFADARWFVCEADVLDEFGKSQDIGVKATI